MEHDPEEIWSSVERAAADALAAAGIQAGDRVWFVDWEAAFRADRFVDLASLANWFCRDEAEETDLLAAYFGRGTRLGYWGTFVVSLIFTPFLVVIFLLLFAPRRRKGV